MKWLVSTVNLKLFVDRCVLLLSDLIDTPHDNCDGGRTDRFNFYCNLMLKPDSFENLTRVCDGIGGQLMWFDTLQEFDILSNRFGEYVSDYFLNGLYTGKFHENA